MAKEQGYYKDVGLDVDIHEFDNSINLSDVVETGKAQFAVGRSSLLVDKDRGHDIVALGAIFQTSPLVLIVRKDSGIEKIEDFRHRRIMMTPDARETISINAMLSSQGIQENDYIAQQHSFNIQDLIDGKTDAQAAYISNEPIVMQEKGIEYRIFDPKDYGVEFYSDLLYTSSEFIEKNPKLTRDFYEATLKGWQYAFEHITESAELISKKYNSQNKTLISLVKEGEELKHLIYDEHKTLGYLDENKIERIIDVYKVMGIIGNGVDVKSFIYEHNHPPFYLFQVDSQHFWLSVILFSTFIGALMTLIIFFYRRNRWLIAKANLHGIIESQQSEINKQQQVIIMQTKLAAIGEMLSNISHQWRQPLNIITLTVSQIETQRLLTRTLSDDELTKHLAVINKESQYLSDTIDDFKNYFTSDTSLLIPFSISNAIKKVIDLTGHTFDYHHIQLIIDPIEEIIITNNENLLIQTILNLLNNVKDAFNDNSIDVNNRFCFISVTQIDNQVRLVIKDSAGGIKAGIMDKVFEPYFTTKHPSAGTGLGLHMAYNIIHNQFKGVLSVENSTYEFDGRKLTGAAFTISLPLYESSESIQV